MANGIPTGVSIKSDPQARYHYVLDPYTLRFRVPLSRIRPLSCSFCFQFSQFFGKIGSAGSVNNAQCSASNYRSAEGKCALSTQNLSLSICAENLYKRNSLCICFIIHMLLILYKNKIIIFSFVRFYLLF